MSMEINEMQEMNERDVTPEVASRRLTQWIVGNPVLLGLLHENGWTASRRVLTPRQVEQIVRILGEP